MWKQHTRVTTKICRTCIIKTFQIEFTCIFSVGKYFHHVSVMMLLTSVSKKQKTNISTDRSGMASKSAFRFGSSTYRLHRYRCLIGTGFRYSTLVTTRLHEPTPASSSAGVSESLKTVYRCSAFSTFFFAPKRRMKTNFV